MIRFRRVAGSLAKSVQLREMVWSKETDSWRNGLSYGCSYGSGFRGPRRIATAVNGGNCDEIGFCASQVPVLEVPRELEGEILTTGHPLPRAGCRMSARFSRERVPQLDVPSSMEVQSISKCPLLQKQLTHRLYLLLQSEFCPMRQPGAGQRREPGEEEGRHRAQQKAVVCSCLGDMRGTPTWAGSRYLLQRPNKNSRFDLRGLRTASKRPAATQPFRVRLCDCCSSRPSSE